MTTIIIFLLVLGVLIFVHELGHFLAAKSRGVKVNEFALGFPPRLFSYKPKGGETRYSLNALPIGGYVQIVGENNEEDLSDEDAAQSFKNQAAWSKIFILSAGVLMNVLFGWIFFSIAFMIGYPQLAGTAPEAYVEESGTMISYVDPESPASTAGFAGGDVVEEVALGGETFEITSAEMLADIIAGSEGEEMTFVIERGEEMETIDVTAREGINEEGVAIGVLLDDVEIAQYPFFAAFAEGARSTVFSIRLIVTGTIGLIADAVTGSGSLDNVAGPVGIAGLVGDAARTGFAYLLSFTALISVNLAIVNLIPIPALDGGRILFVAIESVIRRPLPAKATQWANGVSLALLLLLMVVITVNDIARLIP